MTPGSLELELHGQRLVLLPERGAYWRDEGMLLIADMHCGKAAAFRAQSVPVPEGTMELDLARLTEVLDNTGARRLAILGDWIHAARGCTNEVMQAIQTWRDLHGRVEILWIQGNHDRLSQRARRRFGFEESLSLDIGPFRLQHEPGLNPGRLTIAGHIHPTIALGGRGVPRVKLPCFHVGAELAVLPAFTSFAGGYPLQRRLGSRVYLIADGEVVEWKGKAGRLPVSTANPSQARR